MIRKVGPFVTTMENALEYNVHLLIANGEWPKGKLKLAYRSRK